jgi:hypothetical protein
MRHRNGGRPGPGAALALFALGAGCTIIVEPPDPPPPETVLAPFACVPVRVDPRTGETQPLEDARPPRAHVLFTARLERTAVNLASAWGAFMEETVAGLSALGLHVTNATLLPLDERPVRPVLAAWGCGLDDPSRLTPEAVLRFYATRLDPADQPLGCATDPLVDAGARLGELTTAYPEGLGGVSGRSIFGEVPDLVLVVHLDPLARRAGFDAPGCERAARLADAPGGAATWLSYPSGRVPASRVLHWFVATEEGIDDDALAARCRGLDGFPLVLFDSLEASPLELYAPLAARIDQGPGHAAELPMCALLVEDERRAFLLRELAEIGQRLGVSLDPSLLLALLEGPGEGAPAGEQRMGGE